MAATRPALADAPSTRDRLLTAATEEFAARGFDGAKVDRIAARARVNKAMLYYYFRSKTALYQAILLDLFSGAARAVTAVRERGGPPEVQLHDFIEAVALAALGRPQFPPMWLREIADGGRHLSPPIVARMRCVVETLGAILADGRDAGVFRDVNPFITQIAVVAPLLFFAATGPVRERLRPLVPKQVADAQRQEVVKHVLATTLAAVAAAPAHESPVSSSRRTRP
ncbi:MAG TPA: TetR/AcrR family transcriptional regulator [Vicinamibacterales bacterium]|nr:TetR/AcrR family transcriptional regulator [Vicinamibacterales bacterium]